MPYIKTKRRLEVNNVLVAMNVSKIKADGDLNYILYKYCQDNVRNFWV